MKSKKGTLTLAKLKKLWDEAVRCEEDNTFTNKHGDEIFISDDVIIFIENDKNEIQKRS